MTDKRHKLVKDVVWFIGFAAVWVPFFLIVRFVEALKQ